MNCPACDVELSKNDQKFCEYCGFELKNVQVTKNKPTEINNSSTRFKRGCC